MSHVSRDDPPGIPGFKVKVRMALRYEYAVWQLHRARGRRLAEAFRSLAPELPPEKFQFHGWELAEE